MMAEANERLIDCIVEAAQSLESALDYDIQMHGGETKLRHVLGMDFFGNQVAILAAALYTEKCRMADELAKLRAEKAALS